MRRFDACSEIGLACLRVREQQIAANAVVEHRGLLRDVTDSIAPRGNIDCLEIGSVDQNIPAVGPSQTDEEVDDGRLATSRTSHQRHQPAVFDGEADVVQSGVAAVGIAEIYSGEFDILAESVEYFQVRFHDFPRRVTVRDDLVDKRRCRHSDQELLKILQQLSHSRHHPRPDVYRWQAEVARAQILVLDARAVVEQSWDALNRLLHRPQGRPIALRPASMNDPFVFTQKEFGTLIASRADYERYTRYLIATGLQQAPELMELDSQIDAKRREQISQKRAYWLPEFSLQGTYGSNLGQSGSGAGTIAGEDLSDWNVGLQATLPLFSGGLRKANVSRANLELMQLEAFRSSIAEQVEQEIRLQMHFAQADYARIGLTREAADASRRNFDLVSDAYARGTVSYIELLDAQDTSLVANAASSDSLYNFLITIMAVQRAVGRFHFLLPADERGAVADEVREYITSGRN